jgi:SAM-dependent methyltransferase
MSTQHITQTQPRAARPEFKAAVRRMWALGDYHTFATRTVWEIGPVLVQACGVGPRQRVLDVAAGTGNAAIRAAEAGASVVALDLTPENFPSGQREARLRGVDVEWIEGDAEALPFAEAEFDVLLSSFGAIFAPDHQAVADEMLRVCRPGGVIGMVNFRPVGAGLAFFELLGRYLPPLPPGALPPLPWGSEEHVRSLFGDRASLDMRRDMYVERSESPAAYAELFTTTFGPVIAVRALLEEQPEQRAAFDRELLDFAVRYNSGPVAGPAEYRYDYLLVVARKQ